MSVITVQKNLNYLNQKPESYICPYFGKWAADEKTWIQIKT